LNGDYSCWKQNLPDDQAISVRFVGEDSIDVGGPYRETLQHMVDDLENGIVPLLKKTTNMTKNHGNDRDCFIISDECHTPTHKEMFKFLGVLFGHAFRSKNNIPFKLVPSVWK
jgi:hypothetical protein